VTISPDPPAGSRDKRNLWATRHTGSLLDDFASIPNTAAPVCARQPRGESFYPLAPDRRFRY